MLVTDVLLSLPASLPIFFSTNMDTFASQTWDWRVTFPERSLTHQSAHTATWLRKCWPKEPLMTQVLIGFLWDACCTSCCEGNRLSLPNHSPLFHVLLSGFTFAYFVSLLTFLFLRRLIAGTVLSGSTRRRISMKSIE